MSKKKKKDYSVLIIIIIIVILLVSIIYLLYKLNYIPHEYYYDKDFNINTYHSNIDKDNDGIDDQEDILKNTFKYIDTKPKYKSKYYEGGYPNDKYGVCTDVVAFALRDAGYDLRELVDKHIRENRDLYNIDKVDKNIDFRRVRNLKIYFDNTAIVLTNDLNKKEKFQGGDIVIFEGHIGIISNKRNKNGVPFLIHNGSPYQSSYEQDILEDYKEIIGHYRIS